MSDCFDCFGFIERLSDQFHDNQASGHVLCKLGFEEIGKGMGTSAARENEEQIMECALLRDVFDHKCNDTKS